jgi:hypothetical protein
VARVRIFVPARGVGMINIQFNLPGAAAHADR